MPPMSKLVIEGIPTQAVNFCKAYCHMAGVDEEQFWRREVAGIIESYLALLAEHNPEVIRNHWSLDEAITDHSKQPKPNP
jgi:hypothetical protein